MSRKSFLQSNMTTETLISRNKSNGLHHWTGNPGLRKLCALLRNEGHRVLSGSSTFTLTTEVLVQLNTDCRRHSIMESDIATAEISTNDRSFLPLASRLRAQQEANRVKSEWRGQIQFIKDFMLSTPSLKLIRYSGTLSSPISLHRFGNLTSLNLRKVPIHMVEGLYTLRGTLTSITLYRSVDRVKDLLELCGGDMTAPMVWPQLKFASFMFNSVSSLDDSLRLLPHVEVLDLSHNSLETCERFLEYLGDVQRITLAYNFLTCLPSVSLTTRASLTCLVLRGNNLDSVRGLEVLTSLQELDLGENCISDHSFLDPLGSLSRLRRLQLDGNPVFYHKLHRPLTAACLASQALSLEFELDKRKLTPSEISKAEFKRSKVSCFSSQSHGHVRGIWSTTPDSDYCLSPSSGIGSENESVDSVVSYTNKKKSKHKKLRARRTEIMDVDNSGDVSSSREVTPGTSPHPTSLEHQLKAKREEAITTQREIEELRTHYGPNWLQAIEDRHIFKNKKAALAAFASESSDAENTESENSSSAKFIVGSKTSSGSETKHDMGRKDTGDSRSESESQLRKDGFPTDDDLYLTDTRMSDTDRHIFKNKKAALAAFASESSDAENTESENSSSAKFIVGSKTSSGSETKHDMGRKDTGDSRSESESQLRKDGFPTDDDLYLTDTRMSDTNNPIMAAIARLAAGHSTDDTDGESKPSTSLKFPAFETHTGLSVESKLQKSTVIMDSKTDNSGTASTKSSTSFLGTAAAEKSVVGISNQICPSTNCEKAGQSDAHQAISTSVSAPHPSDQILLNHNVMSLSKQADVASPDKSEGETSSSKQLVSDRNNSITTIADRSLDEVETSLNRSMILPEETEVTESMFATLPLQDNEMIIMTLTASYLVEKDIRGKVTKKVELTSLTNMDWKRIQKLSDGAVGGSDHVEDHNSKEKFEANEVVAVPDDRKQMINGKTGDWAESMQLDLKFDYVRKDRQSRHYIVDIADGNIILAHLQPFLDSREDKEKAKSMVVMQCLKCNRTFLKSELIQQRGQLPSSGSSKDLQSIQELMSRTTLICPKCGSSLIIELEPASSSAKSAGSATSTPVGSYTSSSGSYIDQAKKPVSVKKNSFEWTKDSQSRLSGTATVRDRNIPSIASPRMGRSTIGTSGEQKISEEDELVCIEDHFSASSMTNVKASLQLVEMTTSLQGDSSTRGSKAFVRRASFKKSHSGDFCENESLDVDRKQKNLVDSGYESGIVNGVDKPTRPISIGRRASSYDDEGIRDKEGENFRSGSRRTSMHSNLAAMEDIVNSLVNEGRCLEEQESFGASSYSSSKGKSVSISAFMRSSHGHNRKASVTSIEGNDIYTGLKHSESSSSIAVLPVPASEASLDSMSSVPTFSSSVPSSFSGGTLVGDGIFAGNSEKSGSSAVSPLSSNICSSMVSSVYETSVNNPEGESAAISEVCDDDDDDNGAVNITDNADGIGSFTNGTVTVIGSSSSSSEDLSSIYDHPREPKLSARKQSHSKPKSHSTPSKSNAPEVGGAAISVSGFPFDSQGVLGTTQTQSPSGRSSFVKSAADLLSASDSTVDEDIETDLENDQDVVPQYAFHHLNHRLTLYMMMSLFGTDEEFVCKLQAEVVQYIIEKSYEGILVMSSARFYILKITSEDRSQPPDHWLHCVEIQPIPELRYIDVGLGGQSLRLEFVTDCSSYTFITRSRDKTIQFVEMLHTNLAKYAVSQGIASHVVVNDDVDQTTLSNLNRDVVSKVIPDQKLLHYCMGFIERGNQKHFPMCFVITICDVCLVRTNHQWPQPRLQAPITEETVGKQFTVLERQKISNVATVEVCEATMKKIRLELFNDTDGVSTSWNITLATRQSTVDFINAISEPWTKEFGVEMDVTYAELPF